MATTRPSTGRNNAVLNALDPLAELLIEVTARAARSRSQVPQHHALADTAVARLPGEGLPDVLVVA